MDRAARCGVCPLTKIPKFKTLIHYRLAIITNWASFYRDVELQDGSPDQEKNTYTPKLHLPIMESEGLMTSVWHSAVIFCPRAGEIGMFMITRRFDSDILIQQKAQEGVNVPIGARIL